ncbi:MAG: response regulator transcription factor [Clostridia bacterium]|nr:response regulator transcription factor [Clostridia bacterium]
MNIAICDDDRNYRYLISTYIKESKTFTSYTVCEFESAESLLFSSDRYDIVFLDVEMEEINGIEAGRIIRAKNPDCIIIYISGFSKYAIDSFDNEPLYYILKPINKERLFKALIKAKNKINRRNKKLIIPHKDGIVSVYIKDILYIEYYKKHLTYHCNEVKYETVGKVREAVEKLEDQSFILINQAVLVNAQHIKQISKLDITLNNNEILTMSVRKKLDVIKYYTQYLKEISI